MFLALIFSYPTFSHYPISDSGGERIHKNLWNSLHIFKSLGTCLYLNEVLTLWYSPITSHPSLRILLVPQNCFTWRVLVLSNAVFSSPLSQKSAQDHKVSICITLMCMMISCCCTYWLQEGFTNMEVRFSTISFAPMHIAKIHVTLLTLSCYAFTCSYILS